ncbi:MAG: filamentous hemagglutinin N-terminal domain-containing protein [Xenococcaceae cyanobacterium MO_207.B15]|nr:filamentous hemagglutinin N-terminal domain-containing protein [Xenococcaceae cyanobacterium MO_207.B15]
MTIINKSLHQLFFSGSVTLYGLVFVFPAIAQVTADGTTNTTVSADGNNFTIQDGDRAGNNLFHSFRDFSILNRGSAFFDNNPDIVNIFSRVTGGNRSNIDGLIRANGSANLFLINPAGIIFGRDARLDIGGSFLGSTADSILFPDGIEFSASDTQAQPILTINAPIGLGFRDNPREIVNQSRATIETPLVGNGRSFTGDFFTTGLQVESGNTLALVGGDIVLNGGNLTANGGRIELGSVGGDSFVSINSTESGFVLDYDEVQNFQDIRISPGTIIDTSGEIGGDIKIQGSHITLTDSTFQAPIFVLSDTVGEGKGGSITFDASEAIKLDGDFTVIATFSDTSGTAGDLKFKTKELSLNNGSLINSDSFFRDGQAGDIEIDASELVEVIGTNSFEAFPASIATFGDLNVENPGAAGNLTINTQRLLIRDGGQVSATTFGTSPAGNVRITASDIEVIAVSENNRFASIITAQTALSNGNAGNLTIETERLTAQDGGFISTATFGGGEGGNLSVNASESITLTGFAPSANLIQGSSGLFASAEPNSTGNGGNLSVNTGRLIVEDGATISANTLGTGNAGSISLDVDQLIVRDGGQIRNGSLLGSDDSNLERGAGGTLTIKATESVEVIGTGEINGEPVNSSLFTLAEGTGDAGNLNITTNQLTVADGGEINASATGTGAAGELSITAKNIDLNRGSLTATTAAGSGGNINLDIAQKLTLENQSLISARATEEADGGNVTINSEFIIAFPSNGDGNDIIANAQGGDGGDINITAEALLGIEERQAIAGNGTNDIDASSEFGLDGNVTFNVPDTNNFQETAELSSNVVSAQAVAEDACSPGAGESGLVLLGKGGVPPTPDSPLSAEVLLVDGKPITPKFSQLNNQQTTQNITSQIQPVKTSVGDIYLARGVIVREDGTVSLTAYPTPGTPGYRAYQQKIACQVKTQ